MAAEKALAFFWQEAREEQGRAAAPAGGGGDRVGAGAGTEVGMGVGGGIQQQSGILQRAQRVASELRDTTSSAARCRQQGRDALALLKKLDDEFREGMSRDQAEAMEVRLRALVHAVTPAKSAEAGKAGASDSTEERLMQLQSETALLRRTVVAALGEMKDSIAVLSVSPHHHAHAQ